MSTLRASNLQNASSATVNLALDANGNVTIGNNATVTGTLAMGSSFARNRLINGNMSVYQRGSVAATTSGAYTLDRWFVTPTGATVTVTQSTSVVPTGFGYSLNVAGASSVTNVSAYQRIESLNVTDLASGTAITVSGWIRQSTGSAVTTATVALTTPTVSDNYTSTTSAASTYTIPSIANATWVYFSNSFTLTTSCVNGLQVTIALGTGLTTGSLNLTGLQLEVGAATPFERRQFGQEFVLCQRYYQRFNYSNNDPVALFQVYSASEAWGVIAFLPVTMRAAPTCNISAIGSFRPTNSGGGNSTAFTGGTVIGTASRLSTGGFTGSSGLSGGNATIITANTTAWIDASAEL